MIYHITSRRAWQAGRERGAYRAESLEREGFIHCSTISQVVPVLRKFYEGQAGLLLLKIEPTLLTSDLKWEPPSGGTPPPGVPAGDLFPHIYGPINLEAIQRAIDLEGLPDGDYKLPDDL